MAEIEEGRKYEKIALDCLKENNLSGAESNFLQALTHMKQSGDEEGQAYVQGNLGNLCFQSRRLDKAEEYYGKALAYMEKVNDVRGIVERKLSSNPNLIFSVQTHPRTKYQDYLLILDQLHQPSHLRCR